MNEQINSVGIQNQKMSSSLIKNISFSVLAILCFLLPIFFIPSASFLFLLGKSMVLVVAVFLLFALWAIERIKNKNFSFSKNLFVIFALLIPFAYLLSALFSSSIKAGILGRGFEVSSFGVILMLFLLMFLTAYSFQTKKQIIYLYGGLLFSFILMALFHILRLIFGPNFLSLGLLNTTTANFIGTWSELGIFFGLTAILSLLAVSFIQREKVVLIVGYIVLTISLFFIALINFTSVWLALGALSLFLVAYNLLANRTPGQKFKIKRISIPLTVVFVLSLLFIFARGSVGGFLPTQFNISNFEIRPTVNSTIDIAQTTLATNPILGVGPNGFVKQWVANKPAGINNTQFWNVDFNAGGNFILTTLVNVGLLGFLLWILFLGTLLYSGFKLLKISRQSQFNYYLSVSVFLATVYLWFFSFVYVPGIVIFSLSFLFSGVLLSLLCQSGVVKVKIISFAQNKKKGAVLITVIACVFVSSLFGGYLFARKATAFVQAQKSLIVLNTEGDIGKSIELMTKATRNFGNDSFYRSLSSMNLLQLQAIMNQKDVSEETVREQFQIVLGNAVANAQAATNADNKNYQNWMALGEVYRMIVPLKVEGAYDNALAVYDNAINLNPSNPALILSLANLEIANADIEKARGYIGTAIQMKNNYSEAYYLLSQLELNEGNNEGAVKVIEALANVTPNDPQVFFQLGLFGYQSQDYEQAVPFLERAVVLNPYFADAKYVLGLSYDGVGETNKALGQFEDLRILLPNDNNIVLILENLKNGRKPLQGMGQQPAAAPVAETSDENGEEDLPIDEEKSADKENEEDNNNESN